MAPFSTSDVKCSHCEKIIKTSAPAISCSVCFSWFHKGCSGLTAREFNKQAALWKKSEETIWFCDSCRGQNAEKNKSSSTPQCSRNRLSIGPGATNTTSSNVLVDENDIEHPRDSQISLTDIMNKLNRMEVQYLNLLAKYEEQIKINADLKLEIDTIKLQLSNNKNDVARESLIPDEIVCESIREIGERQLRQKNLMIFGAHEDTSTDIQARRDSDVAVATDIILKTYPEAKTQDITIFRIGRENQSRIRPMKVTLESPGDVKSIIRNAKELRKIQAYKQISLSFDRTPKQIEEYRILKETLSSRLQNGETNLKIKYINGIPRIVNLN